MAIFPGDWKSGAQGRYEVGDVIATGGMSTIYRAFDRLAERDVAYKRVRVTAKASYPRMTVMLRREYDTLARLDHPNVVSVYEFGIDAEGPFYAMELVAGDDLAKRAPLPCTEACRVLRDVASALSLVHARRLVHRDVSPNNVRLTTDGKVKLIDFGALTPFGAARDIVGTPGFISPECLTGEALDQRVDLYSLGALAYWVLTRRRAVLAHSIDELPEAYLRAIPPPSAFAPDVPRALDDLVLSLLQPDRLARPETASEVAEHLMNIAQLAPEQDERKVALSYLKHPPLLGRESVMATFEPALDAAMAGNGGVLLVEGAAGTGRSAVLDELSLRAQLRGATVLRAEGRVHRDPLDGATHLVRTALAVFPVFAHQGRTSSLMQALRAKKSGTTDVVERQAQLAGEAQEILLQTSMIGPLVLLVDDAHLLDNQSLALLASMAESLRSYPILLVLARPSGAPTREADVVLRAAAGQRLTLTPFTESQVSSLVQTMFGGVPGCQRLAHWLFAESGGSPSDCMNLVSSLLLRDSIQYARVAFTLPGDFVHDAGGEGRPSSLSDRVRDLELSELLLCQLLSLSNIALTVSQLADASRLSTPAVLEALHALDQRSLLAESAGRYALASRALASVIASELSPAEQRADNLALARSVLGGAHPSMDERLQAGLHLIRAGDVQELEGARLISDASQESPYELAVSTRAVVQVTEALAVLEKRGYSDLECAHLLTTLSVGGFYGDLTLHRRYFERAIRAASTLSGLTMARRLKRWLGPGLALLMGILSALIAGGLRRSRTPKGSLKDHLSSVINLTTAAAAAAACALDGIEAARIVAWLEPLAPLPPSNPLQIGRQFCLAVAETGQGKLSRPVARFEGLLRVLDKPVRNLDEHAREQLRRGCFHGIGESTIEDDHRRSLDAADELEKTVFFAPHAEIIRMFHAGYRGDRAGAEEHRRRAEALALLGGVSWSALVLLNARAYGLSLMTFDLLELSRTCAEFERVASLSPALEAEYQLATGDLLRLRGRAPESLPIYAAVLETEVGRNLINYRFACAWYARALVESGKAAEAKTFCEARLSEPNEEERCPLASYLPLIEQQLAYAEASLGNVERAASLLEAQLARFAHTENPLLLGTLRRERAHVALLAKDAPAFDENFLAMRGWFQQTQNPWLIQQCDPLLSRWARAGMRSAVSQQSLNTIDAASSDMDCSTAVELAGASPIITNAASLVPRRRA